MIGLLRGKVALASEDNIIIDVLGVGYVVYLSKNIIEGLKLEEEYLFYIETVVREDSITLYGFLEEISKKMFNLLKTVQGVGPKLALAIVSEINAFEIRDAVELEDIKMLQSVSGVGLKVAQRIVNELKNKVSKLFNNVGLVEEQNKEPRKHNNAKAVELRQILESLGYNPKEAIKAAGEVVKAAGEDTKIEDLVKKALNYFAKSI